MNRSRAKELLPIIQAFAEGKEIQWQFDDEPNKHTWRKVKDEDGVAECRPDIVFRIKPEPEVIYVNKLEHDVEVFKYSSKQEAEMAACETWGYEYVAKKFIEVQDD
jgi:hypothetical protein